MSLSNSGSLPLEVNLNNMPILSGQKLQFVIDSFNVGREVDVDQKTSRIVVFEERADEKETATFSGGKMDFYLDPEHNTGSVDNLTFKLNWPLNITGLTLQQQGNFTGEFKVSLGDHALTCANGVCNLDSAFEMSGGVLPLNLAFTNFGKANSGQTLSFKLTNLADRRNIATGTTSVEIRFLPLPPEFMKFVGEGTQGIIETKVDGTQVDDLKLTLNKDLPISKLVLAVSGTAQNNITSIKVNNDKVLTSVSGSNLWTYAGDPMTVSNGATLPVYVTFENVQSGATLQLIVQDLNERRDIDTGSMSKSYIFTEVPEKGEFTDKTALKVYTGEQVIDFGPIALTLNRAISGMTLTVSGTLPESNVKEVKIGDKVLSCSSNTCSTADATWVNGDQPKVTVTLQNNESIASGTTLQFVISAFNPARDIATGSVSKVVTFVNEPTETVTFVQGGTDTQTTANTTINLDTLNFVLNKEHPNQTITLIQTGTLEKANIDYIALGNTKLTNGSSKVSLKSGENNLNVVVHITGADADLS